MSKITNIPQGNLIIWQLQKLGVALGGELPKYGTDGDLGPETGWDDSESLQMLKGVLEELNGGPIELPAIEPPTASPTGMSVFLDIGHGPKPGRHDPGAVHIGSGITEHELNTIFARACEERLCQLGFAVTVADPAVRNWNAGNAARGSDIFISCHHNAARQNAQYSVGLFHETKGRAADKRLAAKLSRFTARALGIDDKGARGMRLSVLDGAIRPGVPAVVLIEPSFMHKQIPDNPLPGHLRKWAEVAGTAAANGVAEFVAEGA